MLLDPWIESGSLLARERAASLADDAAATYLRLGAPDRARAARDRAGSLRPAPRGRARSTLPFGLTEREAEILALVASGRTDREIAQALYLTQATVRKHIEHVKEKTGASRRTELVGVAIRAGLVPHRS